MTTRMLIDARHSEETRVAVVKGNRIEEFDFESAEHKQLKGNIYLAKVTRVEPSLQAAFIEYGGNRHGFLAFSEIHPDYYQIPKEDREALLREEAEHAAEEAAMRAEEDMEELEGEVEDLPPPAPLNENEDDDDDHDDDGAENGDEEDGEENGKGRGRARGKGRGRGRDKGRGRSDDELKEKRMALRRRYKIQDVIKRRQVMLVQVVKEERGNKGAALTTYLSLAGRYCVLMPNTSHGGGISRKIANSGDRKRLKSIIDSLKLPPSVGCIVRTAGLARTKAEIKRDFDYLARLWDEIRERTLSMSAPALIHSDSDLIKRAIRDIYNREIDEVLVEGDNGYRTAKDFMKLMMPSHARRVQHYADPVPLYQRHGVEDQLNAMYNPVVQLKSGGYLVINPTEALVSIDINSGRSTKEHGIEATALGTNLEAAREIARQLRLRDMAGLVVIDFIDMERNGNIRKVERAMKDALKNDRARIQVGRISGFGLMEMSRQRLRTGVLEASTRECPHCEGTGLVRTASSAALSALRMIEEEAAKGKGTRLVLRTSQEASYYLLNTKRAEMSDIEERYGVTVEVLSDGEIEGARMTIDVSGPKPTNVPSYEKLIDEDDYEDDHGDEIDEEESVEDGDDNSDDDRRDDAGRGRQDRSDEDRSRKRRRRGGRGRGARDRDRDAGQDEARSDEAHEQRPRRDEEDSERDEREGDGGEKKRRRRGRRGGRRRRGGEGQRETEGGTQADEATNDEDRVAAARTAANDSGDDIAEAAPEPEARPKRVRAKAAAAAADPRDGEATEAKPDADNAKPARKSRARKKPEPSTDEAAASDVKPARKPRGKVAVGDTEAGTATTAADATEKPKRTRKPAAKAKPEPNAAEASADGDADADAKVAVIKPAPKAKTPAAKPKANAPQATNAESGGARKGWWQRTFGE